MRDARWQVTDLAITQVAIMRQLEKAGPATASELATAEHISPQAVAQQLNGLNDRGYVLTEPDAFDRRKTLISLTRRRRRSSWPRCWNPARHCWRAPSKRLSPRVSWPILTVQSMCWNGWRRPS